MAHGATATLPEQWTLDAQTIILRALPRLKASLTYDNSELPESLLYAYHTTGDTKYKEIAKESFDFLLNLIFTKDVIRVIPNDG